MVDCKFVTVMFTNTVCLLFVLQCLCWLTVVFVRLLPCRKSLSIFILKQECGCNEV